MFSFDIPQIYPAFLPFAAGVLNINELIQVFFTWMNSFRCSLHEWTRSLHRWTHSGIHYMIDLSDLSVISMRSFNRQYSNLNTFHFWLLSKYFKTVYLSSYSLANVLDASSEIIFNLKKYPQSCWPVKSNTLDNVLWIISTWQ